MKNSYILLQTQVGFLQGAVLALLLFNIYINYLPKALLNNKLNCAMYAGVVIWKTCRNMNKKLFNILCRDMNAALTALMEWSHNNNTHKNVPKTNYKLFSLKTKVQDLHLK